MHCSKLGSSGRRLVIALGGGVVGDLAGFAAATVLRGLPFVQIPTTLLAQVDSSVGGKTGINTGFGKNLLGAFHQPRMVLADTAVLATLPLRELRAGYAEIAKAGADRRCRIFCVVRDECGGASRRRPRAASGGGRTRVRVQGRRRRRRRAGGKSQRRTRPSQPRTHLRPRARGGIRVWAANCCMVKRWRSGSASRSCSRQSSGSVHRAMRARVIAHLHAVGLPAELGALQRRFSAEKLMAHMKRDKKMRDGRLSFVLARGVGQAFTCRDVPPEAVASVLRDGGCEE